MIPFRSPALADLLRAFLPVPRVRQYAALCHRGGPGAREILLISSSRGHWILPKGWLIEGQSGGDTALQEAWEEAGVKNGRLTRSPLATYETIKRKNDGTELPCDMTVYAVEVTEISDDFPEAGWRERRWVDPDTARRLVTDDGLRAVLADF